MKPITPFLAVDSIIIYRGQIVLIRRKNYPFQGLFAIPGGYVEIGETTENAAMREAKEETGLDTRIIKLLGVYSEPKRDPRGHVVSICYLSRGTGTLIAGSDAKGVSLFSHDELPIELAFDHLEIIEKSMNTIRTYMFKPRSLKEE